MNQLRSFPLVLDNGERGEVLSTARFLDDRKDRVVRLANGREFLVPKSALKPQDDGSFRLMMTPAELDRFAASGTPEVRQPPSIPNEVRNNREEAIVPVLEEELHVSRQEVETGRIRIHKHVESRDAAFEENLLTREYDVERVPMDQLIPEPLEPRYEGDTLVLPVFEEVLVVEKRLVLREEIRITRRSHERVEKRSVPVRREQIDIERV